MRVCVTTCTIDRATVQYSTVQYGRFLPLTSSRKRKSSTQYFVSSRPIRVFFIWNSGLKIPNYFVFKYIACLPLFILYSEHEFFSLFFFSLTVFINRARYCWLSQICTVGANDSLKKCWDSVLFNLIFIHLNNIQYKVCTVSSLPNTYCTVHGL